MTVILDQFIHTLVHSGLMTTEEVDAFIDGFPPEDRPTDGEGLAKLLFQRKKLTKFQTQCVYQGKTKGLIVGNYLVLDKIGAGGMGHVYKAQHKRMKRVVALKALPSSMTATPVAVRRFEREVEVAARLEHPNIVTAFDADEADGIHFLVMQYIEGCDLAELICEKGTLSVPRTLDYIIQAGRGLDYAHAQGVVHRDIKPSNLLLDDKGTVKILDMGLARLEQEIDAADTTEAAALTHSGQMMGTVDYMSPEQSLDTHMADHRADIYSLGCTLYYLLTGRSVFGGDTLTKRILAHREEQPPSLRALRPDVPRELDAVFLKMLAKRPEDRQAKISTVLAELETCRSAIADGAEETIACSEQYNDTGPIPTEPLSGVSRKPDLSPLSVELETSGTQHEITIEKDADSALDRWLNEKLPDGPTHFITKPNRQSTLTPRKAIAASAIAGVCFLVLLFVVIFSLKTFEGTDVPTTEKSAPQPATVAAGNAKKRMIDTSVAKPANMAAWAAILPTNAPSAAIAPFDSATAKKHQEAWAKYLGVPVEQDIRLADGLALTMVLIPPGEFAMGSSAEDQARFLEEAKAVKDA